MRLVLAITFCSTVSAAALDLSVPNPALTPGVATSASKEVICATKWSADRRHVTDKMRLKVFTRYGLSGNDDAACIPDRHGRRCEIDHLVSRELGGADVVDNLWPQPYGLRPWGAVLKDRLENRLHKEVCAGRLSLEDAQRIIVEDWRIAYRTYFGGK